MSTNLEIITDALRAINVLDETETASAEQGVYCLRQLNQMLAAWEVDDIALGYFAQTSTAVTCPIPDWAEVGVTNKLGIRVSSQYAAQVPPGIAFSAEEGYQTILRTTINMKLKGLDMTHMAMGLGQTATYDITLG